MKLTFLEAEVPLTKHYELREDGTYASGSYPGVTNFTSHVEHIDTTQEFAQALKTHSSKGHCLLTNSLTREIENESRASLSDKHERRPWIVLDIDGVEGVETAEDFVQQVLPQPFHNVSYVVQYSPSHGIKEGVRAHLFFLLYDAVDPRAVESWLAEINLDNEVLRNQVTLSSSNLALSYPLDRVASRNGRIVYITPPECVGFDDPLEERIVHVEKMHDRLSFAFASSTATEIAVRVRDKVNKLRDEKGLKVSRKNEHYRVNEQGQEIMHDELVERGIVTSWHEDNDKFMRCNINGGDSYAYYYHRDQENPLVHNFKGEPSFRLKLFDPEFYREHVVPHFEALAERQERPFIFRDRATDKWFVGTRRGLVVIDQPNIIGSQSKYEDYFAEYRAAPPAVVPTWDRIFDPTMDTQFNQEDKLFNTWRKTSHQENTLRVTRMPPICEKVIRHVTGSDDEAFEHFVNWLAFIQQRRVKPGTAWVLHGVPGTGKGLLFHNIVRPIFGEEYCVGKQLKDLKDKFNGWMEQCLFVNIDEANSEDAGYEGREIVNSLKNWITEPTISLRHMQAVSVNRPSFINFIFTTNDFGMLPIQDGDRRFNVAPRQEEKIDISANEIAGLRAELDDMSAFLSSYEVDEIKARTPLENDAKQDLKRAARSSIQAFFDALNEADLGFFIQGTSENSQEYEEKKIFQDAVETWKQDVAQERTSYVTTAQAKAAHVVMCRDKNMKVNAFGSMAAKRGTPPKRLNVDGRRITGWKINWRLDEEDKVDQKLHLQPVVSQEEMEQKIRDEMAGKPR